MKRLIQVSILSVLFAGTISSADASLFSFGKKYHRSMISGKSKVKTTESVMVKAHDVTTDITLEDIYKQEEVSLPEATVEKNTRVTEAVEAISVVSDKTSEPVIERVESSKPITQITSPANSTIVKPSRAQIKEVKRALKNAPADGQRILEIVLAIFLPPIAILIHENDINYKFFLGILLWILGILPGIIYALLVVFDKL